MFFFFSSRRRHTRCGRDWSSDVCSSDLDLTEQPCNPHCKELVEVRGEDRTKLDALEQRQPLVRSELEHPLVEIQPRELAVDSLRSNELVEVRGEDRTKLDALEQRQPLVRSELEHPLVEIQPRELAVDSLRSNELELRTNCAYSHIEQWCNRTVRYRL